jgi:hypothetical protein
MQQRQLRLGDILDDYCPRERRVTNHAVVAMIGSDVKQTRCTTCDADHEYKHAKVPRQRKKVEAPVALHPAAPASGPKRVSHDSQAANGSESTASTSGNAENATVTDTAGSDGASLPFAARKDDGSAGLEAGSEIPGDEARLESTEVGHDDEGHLDSESDEDVQGRDEGPVHRPLIRASLPRPEGQQPPARPIPEFTIRQPGGRPNRFRPRHHRGGGQQFQGNRSNGNLPGVPSRGPRPGGGRPPLASRLPKRHGPDGQRRKRSK